MAGSQVSESLKTPKKKLRPGLHVQMPIPWVEWVDDKEKFHLFVETFPLPVAMISKSGRYDYINPKFTQTFGYTLADIQDGRSWFLRAYPDEVHRARAVSEWLRDLKEFRPGEFRPRSFAVTCKNGEEKFIIFRPATLAEGGQLVIYEDITESKKAEKALKESEERYKNILESIEEGYFEVDLKGNLTFFNPAICSMLGYRADELLGMNNRSYMDRENAKKIYRAFNAVYRTGLPSHDFNWEIIRKDGARLFVETSVSLIKDEKGRPAGFRGIVRDTTERKKAEEALRENEERYRQLVNHAPAGIYEVDFHRRKFVTVNDIMCEYTGYAKEELLELGPLEILDENSRRTFAERMGKVLAGEKVPETVEYKIRKKDGRELWIILNSRLVYENGYPKGATAVVHDITERKRAEDELNATISKLRKITGATIQAMAQTVEVRDPYTAGHQRRVADLARAIATALGLEGNRIDGIRMAGAIHDIGKISVPAEILSKPGILSPLEFSFIKTHSQVGYEILKDIEFPWDIAQMVLQHHERMDGSGYPNGISGEEILLEARILAVADVVEAMASHRPYRPAVGLDKALEEISSGRGLVYDGAVVDACLRLFKEHIFSFK